MTLSSDFKGMPLFEVEYLRNGTRHSYNGILIGICTCSTHQYKLHSNNIKRLWATAKFSTTCEHCVGGLFATAELLVKLKVINCHFTSASNSLNLCIKVTNNILLRHYCWLHVVHQVCPKGKVPCITDCINARNCWQTASKTNGLRQVTNAVKRCTKRVGQWNQYEQKRRERGTRLSTLPTYGNADCLKFL